MSLSFEESLEGHTLVSAETSLDILPNTIESAILNNQEVFFTYLRFLSASDQETLLAYYFLSKTQTDLAVARVGAVSQTLVSQTIRSALRTLSCYVLHKGHPSEEAMMNTFTPAGVDTITDESKSYKDKEYAYLSTVVALWAKTKPTSYGKTCLILGIPRQAVMRKAVRTAANVLEAKGDDLSLMFSAYLSSLHDRSIDRRVSDKVEEPNPVVRTSPILGQFRINVSDPAFDQIFTNRNILKEMVEEGA